ncbi:MAG: hypothetical protein AAFX85_04320 [Pseudomonadota bacterium]
MVDRIRDGNGYALIVVHTNWEPYEIGFERLQLFFAPETGEGRTGKVRVRRSGELELVELPAGRYRWREARLGQHAVPLSDDSGFRVIEGAITYIGDLHAAYDPATRKLVRLEVAENQAQVRERAREANGPLLDRYPLQVDEIMTLVPSPPLADTRATP